MLKNEMESYVRIGGRGLKNLKYPYMGVGGLKNCQIILTYLMNGPLYNTRLLYICYDEITSTIYYMTSHYNRTPTTKLLQNHKQHSVLITAEDTQYQATRPSIKINQESNCGKMSKFKSAAI